MEGLVVIGIFVGIVAIIIIGLIIGEARRKARTKCPSCKKKYDYEEDVAWTITSEKREPKQIIDYVDITCVCAACGEKRKFSTHFTVASVDQNGNVKERNIEDMIEKCMK